MRYRRTLIEGATYFFTVNLAERSSALLVDRVDDIRAVVGDLYKAQPFEIAGWVVLPPDHLHAIWRLPEGDAEMTSMAISVSGGDVGVRSSPQPTWVGSMQ